MGQDLTIVMYHYVRDFARSWYPDIKGLDVAGFRRQLDHLTSRFQIVRMEDVIDAVRGTNELPPDAALLTFDDGYADHFDVVFPILHDRGIQGSFFPPVAPVRDGTLLDVNRVHYILASTDDPAPIAATIDEAVEASQENADVQTVADYRAAWAHPNRFDDAETIYIKRMLQTALPVDLRESVARDLFARFVSVDEATFAAELYMTRDQARHMVRSGMYFGSHGTSHVWLNHADDATRRTEINGSLDFLAELGMPTEDSWVMCYPFGGWDAELANLLREYHCTVGLTTRVATAKIGVDDPLALPRFDTNDFPQ